MSNSPTTYSFLADDLAHVQLFMMQSAKEGYINKHYLIESFQSMPEDPHCVVEFESQASLKDIEGIIEMVPDNKTMLDTIRNVPLTENCLEREYVAQLLAVPHN